MQCLPQLVGEVPEGRWGPLPATVTNIARNSLKFTPPLPSQLPPVYDFSMMRAVFPLILLGLGLLLGTLSAQYMMETASGATPVGQSGWNEIRIDKGRWQTIYLVGHFLRRGQVPPPKGTRFFARNLDDDGNSLRGDCLVTVEGQLPPSRWWFVSASAASTRTTFDAAQAVRETSGETNIAVSVSPVPGNWLAPPGGGAYELQLVLLGVADDATATALALPRVKRLWC
jgi:hypothetical protein